MSLNSIEFVEVELTEAELKEKTSKNLLYVGCASIVMLFAGFTSAWFVLHGGNFWVNIMLPPAFLISTIVIVASSATLQYSMIVLKRGKARLSKLLIATTLVLGIGFSVSQWFGWGQMIDHGYHLVGGIIDKSSGKFNPKFGTYGEDFSITFQGNELIMEDGKLFKPNGKELSATEYGNLRQQGNTASSMIYILTAMHLLHLLGGLFYLISVSFKSFNNRFTPENHLKIKLISIYWHFLGGLWIYLYLFLQFIH
jgi:cytochrome c oxidase subunit III